MLMTHHRNFDGLDPRAQAEHGRLALNVFAELTHQGGTNAVADAEGIAFVVPDLIPLTELTEESPQVSDLF